eukprot:TRINITY_DN3737_c0_g1_i1.p1 TRINITY_DN3737_c0_g1~~TRINITY_DN3737_c0_g1_i1.p1  ORF type:complete len:395 (-),score=127.78 TRINITY_DN3737_c0_g1_i1:960-2117(-)
MKKYFQSVDRRKWRRESLPPPGKSSGEATTATNVSRSTPAKCHVKRLLRLFERKLAKDSSSFKRTASVDEEDYEEIQAENEEEEEEVNKPHDIEDDSSKGLEACNSPPSYPIIVKCTKEIAGFNELSEGLLRLDFPGALRDIRRFRYVGRVMHILLRHDKLRTLPGAAQKLIFRMLEEMADVVYESQSHEDILRSLMEELHATMTIYNVWGSHLGSSQLFQDHLQRRQRITEFVEKMQARYKQDLASLSASPDLVSVLPEECVREILLRLSSKKDLLSAADTCSVMDSIVKEKRIWRELVQAHFSKPQIESLLKEQDFKGEWKALYDSLRKKWEPKETFGDLLYLCRSCCSLYWGSLQHICPMEYNEPSNDVPIMPTTYLSFFSV